MDTRNKILSQEAAAGVAREAVEKGKRAAFVTGYFDPLLAGHAQRLEEIGRAAGGIVVVLVTDPPRPVLPARARAELVAALAVVDYVVITEGAVEEVLRRLPAGAVFREETADSRRREDLVSRVWKLPASR